ncbi:ATP-binding protein [Martelella radicis]|uniref:histidine kinase n=1 Tax=Martelella radicis TaxID=1397476 RepID=A0A7W6KH69_9HYPH|nr:PAS domain S-box-containing protein [Martelella radicis]
MSPLIFARAAFFSAPLFLLLFSIGWTGKDMQLPFAASIFCIVIMVVGQAILKANLFRFLAALSTLSAALILVAVPLQQSVGGEWVAAAVLSFVGVALSAVFLDRRSREIGRLLELETLTDTVPALLWTADGERGVDYVNQRWQDLGWTYEDLSGHNWGVMMHPDDLPRLRRQWQASVDTGKGYEETMRVRKPWGDYRWMVIRATPERDENGAVLRWCGIASDIDDLKKAEDRLEVMRNDLARVTRANTMGELTASIAHDINQPLTAAVTNGQVALRWLSSDAPDLGEVVEAVEESVAGAKRASDVVERLRNLYQNSEIKPVAVDVRSVIEDSVSLVSALARRSDVALQVELAAELAPILGDPIQLQQVVINLVVNGIDATKSVDRPSGTIVIRASTDPDGRVAIEVEDEGMGISPEIADRLFDAFFSTKSSGLGMGLAICRTIIERLGGTITTRNAPNGGAIFRACLPPVKEREEV